MVEVFNNPALEIEEDVIRSDGIYIISVSAPENHDDVPQSSSTTVIDTISKHTKQASSTGNISSTAHNYTNLSKWLSRTIDIIIARRGLILALFSAFFYSWMSVLLEILSNMLDTYQTVVMVMPAMLVGPSLGIVITHAARPKEIKHYAWLLLNGISSTVGFMGLVLSIRYMDVADAVAISYSSLIVVCILSWIILKERLRGFDFLFSSIALGGVVFIARPQPIFGKPHEDNDDNASNYLLGITFALVCAVGIGTGNVCFRKQCQLKINTFVSMLSCASVVTFSNTVICTTLNQWSVPDLQEWMYATGAGLCYFFAQLCLIISLNLETATIVSIILAFEVVFTFVWQIFLLRVLPLWTSYVGAMLLICASVGITLYKHKTTEPQLPEQKNKVEDISNDLN